MSQDELIRAIHRSGRQCVLAITGGGATAIGELLRVPGGSSSVLEAVVPYSWPALVEWLGGAPDQACSAATARAMAMAAWQRARKLADASMPVEKLIGIGCTASLASDRPKRGEHRFFVAIQTDAFTDCLGLTLRKDTRSRAEEEPIVASFLLHHLALAGGVGTPGVWHSDDLHVPEMTPPESSERCQKQLHMASPEWRSLMLGDSHAVYREGKYVREYAAGDTLPDQLVLSGAFNPVHDGHRAMVATADAMFSRTPCYELSIANVDKPPLDYIEIAERLRKFAPHEGVCLTRAPTFVEKSRIFPRSTFLVGADTIVRIGDPKYYGDDEAARDEAIATLAKNGADFLVFGRVTGSDFKTIDDLPLPPALRELCEQVSEDEFRADISSTEIRKQQDQQQQ